MSYCWSVCLIKWIAINLNTNKLAVRVWRSVFLFESRHNYEAWSAQQRFLYRFRICLHCYIEECIVWPVCMWNAAPSTLTTATVIRLMFPVQTVAAPAALQGTRDVLLQSHLNFIVISTVFFTKRMCAQENEKLNSESVCIDWLALDRCMTVICIYISSFHWHFHSSRLLRHLRLLTQRD